MPHFKKHFFRYLSALVLILCLLPVTVSATTKSGDLSMPAPSKEDIAMRYQQAKQATFSKVYDVVPSVTSPYATGTLNEDYLRSGLAHLNYIRYAAGLPAATLDEDWNVAAQHGAVVLAAINQLTHYPSQPSGMSNDFYQQGYAATSSANISYRYNSNTKNYIISSLTGCMSDSSASNLPVLGHRRWLINPLQSLTAGFGEAKASSGGTYVVTKLFENSSYWYEPCVDYEFVAWPAAGNFPNDLFVGSDPWSVTLNTDYYAKPDINQVSVTITRKADGKSWTLDKSDYKTGSPSNTKPYFNVDLNNYGPDNCIIFNPGSGTFGSGTLSGVYTVSITGIYTKSGAATSLSYDVDFFNPAAIHLPSYTVTIPEAAGGVASISSQTVTAGENVSFTVTPKAGYELAMVFFNGVQQPLQETFTVECVSADTVVTLVFKFTAFDALTDGTFFYVLKDDWQLTVTGLYKVYDTAPVSIPESFVCYPVTTIGNAAFRYCELSGITIPDSITTIEPFAFFGSGLTGTVTIPSSVTTIGTFAFAHADGITAFEVDPGNSSFTSIDGVLYSLSYGEPYELRQYPAACENKTLVLPDTVESIYGSAFADAVHLKRIYATNRILHNASDAFSGCELAFYGYSSTSTFADISSNKLENCSITAHDIFQQEQFALLDNNGTPQLLILNFSGSPLQSKFFLASYQNGQMHSCQTFTANVDYDSAALISGTAVTGDLMKLFFLNEDFIPQQAPLTQPLS